MRSSAGIAHAPHEVLAWLTSTLDKIIAEHGLTTEILRQSGIATPEDRRTQQEVRFWMAERGIDVLAVQALTGGRIAHYVAHAMRGTDCTPRIEPLSSPLRHERPW